MLEVCQILYTPCILCPSVFFSFLYHLLLCNASFRLEIFAFLGCLPGVGLFFWILWTYVFMYGHWFIFVSAHVTIRNNNKTLIIIMIIIIIIMRVW